MKTKEIQVGGAAIGGTNPLFLVAGPCVIESEDIALETATVLRDACAACGMPYMFKSSYDKANRSSINSFRGPGLEKGLDILARVRDTLGVPVITDVHSPDEAAAAAKVVDALQVPAFLSRQTDLLLAAGKTGLPVNVKKSQMMSPAETANIVAKLKSTGNDDIILTERGTFFGYHNLVNDFTAIAVMRALGCPVLFDATHSAQQPGGRGDSTGGKREFVPVLARAAVAVGVDGLFIEAHPNPDTALCDGPNSLRLADIGPLLEQLVEIDRAAGARG